MSNLVTPVRQSSLSTTQARPRGTTGRLAQGIPPGSPYLLALLMGLFVFHFNLNVFIMLLTADIFEEFCVSNKPYINC